MEGGKGGRGRGDVCVMVNVCSDQGLRELVEKGLAGDWEEGRRARRREDGGLREGTG